FFSSRRRHTRSKRDWSSDVCSSDLAELCPLDGRARIQKDPGVPVSLRFPPPPVRFPESRAFRPLSQRVSWETSPPPSRQVLPREIGRASCRERVCISVIAAYWRKGT